MVIHSISASRGSLLILPIQTKRVITCVEQHASGPTAGSQTVFNLVSALVVPSGSVARVRR